MAFSRVDVHSLDPTAYIIISEVADIFSNNMGNE